MRHHDVIENDILVEEIWATAQSVGFTDIELAVAAPHSARMGLAAYTRMVTGAPTPEDSARLLETVIRGADNLRIFFIRKGDEPDDSRPREGAARHFQPAPDGDLRRCAEGPRHGHQHGARPLARLRPPTPAAYGSA